MPAALPPLLYLALLHLALAALAWIAFAEQPIYLLLAELTLLVSLYFAYRLYRGLIAPLRLLSRGAAALADQDFSVRLVETGSREMNRLVDVYNQMVDQLRAERVAARQREEFLDRVVNGARLGVVVLDFDGGIASMNSWLRERAGEADFDRTILQPALSHPRPRPEDEQRGAPEATVLTGPGNRRYRIEQGTFLDRSFERRFVVIQDVSAELLGAEKAAYGKVIRMMAHEVNNSGAAISSVLETLRGAAVENDPELADLSRTYLPIVLERSANLTKFMRRFAGVIRLPAPDLRRVDLNDILQKTVELLRPAFNEANIGLQVEVPPRPVMVRADRSQLEQVVINALTNARESIGADGQVVVTATERPVGFVVADNGPGIPEEVADRPFTPFFSTKPGGQGVGLTLTRDILEGHGATYALATEGDGWTRLRVGF